MDYLLSAFLLSLLSAGLANAVLAVWVCRRRGVPGMAAFGAVIALGSLWSLSTALELTTPGFPDKVFWANIEYLGCALIPVGWLIGVAQYTDRAHWVTPRRVAALLIVPMLTLALVWTDPLHGLMRSAVYMDASGPVPGIGEIFGPYFWFHTTYSYALLVAAVVLLIWSLARSRPAHRGQQIGLLVAVALPMLADLAYLVGIRPLSDFELTPVLIGVSGIVITWSLLRHRLFDIVPIAHDAIIAGLRDAVVVLDTRQHVVDMNAAGRRLFPTLTSRAGEMTAAQIFAPYPSLVALCQAAQEAREERVYVLLPGGNDTVMVNNTGSTSDASAINRGLSRAYDVRISPLWDQRGRWAGQIVTFHDVTDRQKNMEELQEMVQKYRTITENTSDLICELDAKGKFLYASPNHREVLGYDPGDLLGRPALELVHPEDQMECWQNIHGAIRTFTSARISFRARHAGERWVWMEAAGRPFRRSSGEVVFSMITRDMTERKQVEEALLYASFHDSLTNLYNRAYFEEEIRRLEGSRLYPITVVSTDIDGLKPINDTMGHRAGDELLRRYAGLLRLCLRGSDVVARVGGDEFAIVLPNTDRATAEDICRRLEELVQSHNQHHPDMTLSISWGAETADTPELSLEDALRTADLNMYRDKLQRKASGRHQLVGTLLAALDAKDHVSEGHTSRVRTLAVAMGRDAGLSREEISDLTLLADVHDLGKVGIPDSILFKPGPLTPEERAEVEQHPAIGYKIARSSPDLAHVAELILHHHEWWNGQGYPFGMRGEEIPLACRILAVVDAYDAITNDQPYRKAASAPEGLAEIRRRSGTQFDPAMVEIFCLLFPDVVAAPAAGSTGTLPAD